MRLRSVIACAAVVAGGLVPGAAAQRAGDTTDVRDLPVVEVPAHGEGNTLAILLSGDGGWASIDKDIAGQLAAHGVAVVGLNLKSYLGKERTPDETSADVLRLVKAYQHKWNRDRLAIVGFSRGADVAPFVVARFPEDVRSTITLVALVGLARQANFKWHLQDVFREVKRPSDVPVRPELDRIKGLRMICIFGADEKESGCRDTPADVTRIERPGGHHMDGDYKAVGDLVADALKR